MAGRGPPPKPAALRQRRNRTTTAATLPTPADASKRAVPSLPKRTRGTGPWHPQVTAWWKAIWRSPMAEEFLGSDMLGGLYCLAELYQRRWTETKTTALVQVVAEIRQQEVRFGLTPMDRRRLQWEIPRDEAPPTPTEQKPSGPAPPDRGTDPRQLLKVMP